LDAAGASLARADGRTILPARTARRRAAYRRYEWKCDALNTASRAAAQRLGFSFEGLFRQARVDKGRNRDTAWYAVIDREWPALSGAFERWLAPANFDDRGHQRISLSELTMTILARRG
jgi:hypothetical protein